MAKVPECSQLVFWPTVKRLLPDLDRVLANTFFRMMFIPDQSMPVEFTPKKRRQKVQE